MTRYLKSHRWLAGAAAVVIVGALAVAACGGSSKLAKDAPPSGASTAASGGLALGASPSESERKSVDSIDSARSGAIGAAPANDGVTSPDGDGTGGAEPNALPSTLDRKIIQTATLELTTEEVSKRFEDVGNIAAAAGGFIASSSFGNSDEQQTASITIRVPGESYQRVLTDLRKLGDVKSEQSGANDVTEEYTDLQSRLRNLKATEEQYIQFLLRAESINEVLAVQDRLNATRAEIEQVQGRINLVEYQTDLATITVHLDPPVVSKVEPKDEGGRGPLEVAADSFQASLDVLLGIATVALAVLAFSWWIVPLAIAGGLIGRRQLRGAHNRPVAPPPASPVAS